MTHQPAISFSISFRHPFNRAGGRTSNVLQEMKMIHAACFTLLALAGCSERKSSLQDNLLPVQESPINTFKGIINSGGDLVFTDTVKQGPGSARESIKLRFSKDSNVTIEEFGYGIDIYPCAFTINSDGDLTLMNQRNQTYNWPKLVISREGDRLTLSRKDGLRSFKEHGNFWPEVVDRVFPLEAKLPDKQKRRDTATPTPRGSGFWSVDTIVGVQEPHMETAILAIEQEAIKESSHPGVRHSLLPPRRMEVLLHVARSSSSFHPPTNKVINLDCTDMSANGKAVIGHSRHPQIAYFPWEAYSRQGQGVAISESPCPWEVNEGRFPQLIGTSWAWRIGARHSLIFAPLSYG